MKNWLAHFHKMHTNRDKETAWDFLKKERIPKTIIELCVETYGELGKISFKRFGGRPFTVATSKVKNIIKMVFLYFIKDSCSANEHFAILDKRN